MGSKSSRLNATRSNDESSLSGESSDSDDSQSFSYFDVPESLLIDILAYVPAKDLIKNCRLVCKDWKYVIDGHSLWKVKCRRDKKNIPSITLPNIPDRYYAKIYFHDPYGKNLIQNPCGDEGLAKWIVRNNGDSFVVENPPNGSECVPQEVGGSQSCFATTYYPCMKHQIVDLYANGISKEILELKTTKIRVGEWFAARFDCSSEYHLYVVLLDEKFHKFVESLQPYTVDEFRFQYKEDQWVGREWHHVDYTFHNVGKARYVYFQHDGKDCLFWAGYYGSKMTGAFVKVIV